MSDNLAGLIVFLIIAGSVVALITLGRFISSLLGKKSSAYRSKLVHSEEDEFTNNVAKEMYDKKSEEISRATMGSPNYSTSIYYLDPDNKGCDST